MTFTDADLERAARPRMPWWADGCHTLNFGDVPDDESGCVGWTRWISEPVNSPRTDGTEMRLERTVLLGADLAILDQLDEIAADIAGDSVRIPVDKAGDVAQLIRSAAMLATTGLCNPRPEESK